ncbi:MAG TPA: type III secretion inner membrane ring lipoprotein SctJ [Limnobacter sp.]|uniref:type III secretion system inner membrane ring lipoprotein SctJ n=1 Tax=Limnobacter sp. TaxID=2003368 RepID=UPI002E3279B2|nr:type III secretion inner membrane ring lipoprotein SctJ [Limnobacter sp.]HEX5487289.1 type III secretion inner membrane ring lipoprotein SctJ [Limnobacter sp.]
MISSASRRLIQLILLMIMGLALQACSQSVSLFSGLSQEEGNEIYASLLAAGIPAEKASNKEGITVSVPSEMSSDALKILQSQGLPREKKASMGDVFKKDSMISSPLEERARYLYALSQELEDTLMKIDGVLAARIHIVLPERTNPGDPLLPSSAAVFVKYANGSSFPAYIPKVRELVFNAIPGITGDPHSSISVVAIPSEIKPENGITLLWYGPMALRAQDRFAFLSIIYLIFGLWVLSLGLVWLQAKDESDWPEALQRFKARLKK